MEKSFIDDIRQCSICAGELPLPPRPLLQFSSRSKILLIGQAPGLKAHQTQKPWNDASGERLRRWMGVDDKTFYDPKHFAVVPMGFCYPGKAAQGDMPPRPECRAAWMDMILDYLQEIRLTLLVGRHAIDCFVGKGVLKDQIKEAAELGKDVFVLPHPSPLNNIWLSKNRWFEEEIVAQLQRKVAAALKGDDLKKDILRIVPN